MFDIQVSKEDLFNKVKSEEVFEYYLNGNFVIGRAIRVPWRSDSTPSLSLFYSSDGTLLYKDHADNKVGNCVSFIQKLYNLDYSTALKKIKNDLLGSNRNLINRLSLPMGGQRSSGYMAVYKHKPSISITYKEKEFSKQDLQWWGRYGISDRTLVLFLVKCASHVYYNGKLWMVYSNSNPIYIYERQNQIKIYKPLAPKGYRWSGNMKSNTLLGINKIPDNYNKLILLNKSFKDVMSVYENNGILGVCKSGENCYWNQEDIDLIKTKSNNLVYLGDFDKTGLNIANTLHREFNIPRIFMSNNRHERRFDYTDYYLNFGKDQAINKLNQLVQKYGNKIT